MTKIFGEEVHGGDTGAQLASFEVAMRLLLFDILETAEAEANARPEAFDEEHGNILLTAEALAATESELAWRWERYLWLQPE